MKLPKKNIDVKYNLKVYFSLLSNYRISVVLLLLMVFIMEFLRVGENFLFKIILDNASLFSNGSLVKEAFLGILFGVAATFISVHVFKIFLVFQRIDILNKLDGQCSFDLKNKMFNHIIDLSHKFHVENKTGSIISRVIKGSGSLENMNGIVIFRLAPLIFSFIVVASSLAYFDYLTAIIALITIIAFIGYSLFIQKIQEKPNLEANNQDDIEKGYLADYFTNIDSIKLFGKTSLVKKNYKNFSMKTKIKQMKFWGYFRFMDTGHSFITATGMLTILAITLNKFVNGIYTLGEVTFIFTTFTSLIGPLHSFVNGLRGFYRCMADFEVLFKYLKQSNEIIEKKSAKDHKIKNGIIEFKNISFGYNKKKIINNLNFKVNKNKKIALVGHSGCGKSTLVKLLYRLYNLTHGDIFVDGLSIKDYKKESLRGQMSIVPQECVLFDDTIYNNIAFSNSKAKKSDVLKAIKFAQLDKVIKGFDKKEQTIVGERGVKLSGGEKQRVSIARAILANKPILVLDEATSALDSETEHEIQSDLEKLMKNRTSIIIAHRLSTIMHADKIVVMEKGSIVETGTHKELLKHKGKYKKLWELQKGGFLK